jgi:DNA-binding MarR family transcriptional regulator
MILENFNKAFESKARLGIMSVLLVNDAISFTGLKDVLDMTDGNLATHLRTLEDAGYVAVQKEFVGRKPNTSYSVTPQGRKAFDDHLNVLEQLIKSK